MHITKLQELFQELLETIKNQKGFFKKINYYFKLLMLEIWEIPSLVFTQMTLSQLLY